MAAAGLVGAAASRRGGGVSLLSLSQGERRVACAGAQAPRAREQLLPQALGVLAEHGVDFGAEHRPQAAIEFALQLARAPGDVADVVARLVRRGLDDFVDRRDAEREVQILHQVHRAFTRVVLAPHQSDQRAARERPAVVHGFLDLLRGLVLREQADQRTLRRPVENHADMAAVGRRRGDEHGLAIVGVAKRRMCDQQHRVVVAALSGCRRGSKQGAGGKQGEHRAHPGVSSGAAMH